MKTTIDKEFFKKNNAWFDVVYCKTEEEAKEFCKILDKNGYKWRDEDSYLKTTEWDFYNTGICYIFNEGIHGKYEDILEDGGYEILNFEDYIIDEVE